MSVSDYGVWVSVGNGISVNVGAGVPVGVTVKVAVTVGVVEGVGVEVKVTAGRSIEPTDPSPSSSRKIQPSIYCSSAASGWFGAI